jgi:site-specific recombinase XerD
MLPEVLQFQKWLRRKYPTTTTPIHYPSDVALFFKWVKKNPTGVTVLDIDLFIEHSQQKAHSIATINRRLASLHSFYEFLATQTDPAPVNPVLFKRHFIRHGIHLPRGIPDVELKKLLNCIDNSRDRAMFLLMLRCGLRVGEVRDLTLNSLSMEPSQEGLPRLLVCGKGGTKRIVYLSGQAFAALEAWLDKRPTSSDPALFLNKFGKKISITGIQGNLAHYCRKAGLWVTCHQFRHTFGRQMIESRVPVTSIQRLLGHTRLQTTEIYLHISDCQIQKDYESAIRVIAQRFPQNLLKEDET